YTVRNQDAAARSIIIEHPARPDWKLACSGQKPEEQAPGLYRFRVEAPANAAATLSVMESRVTEAKYEISSLDADNIALFVKQGSTTPEIERELRKVLAQKAVVAKLEEEMEFRQKDIDRIVADQQRLRENLKALKGSAEERALVQR